MGSGHVRSLQRRPSCSGAASSRLARSFPDIKPLSSSCPSRGRKATTHKTSLMMIYERVSLQGATWRGVLFCTAHPTSPASKPPPPGNKTPACLGSPPSQTASGDSRVARKAGQAGAGARTPLPAGDPGARRASRPQDTYPPGWAWGWPKLRLKDSRRERGAGAASKRAAPPFPRPSRAPCSRHGAELSPSGPGGTCADARARRGPRTDRKPEVRLSTETGPHPAARRARLSESVRPVRARSRHRADYL